ncbi:tRNA (guanosine(46)-N7)-methyltransferase TrmB [Malacoplasma iowae]|uniref:tRNA (guanosine(46)-N7)-methyltransferase TrmB n=1 Tax=Malacoplasma iowae TaxID=2116 RepID=UPI002A189784|nr:tRNA (guanosine(46)-N7)-methyltransferase TrmB [Malacoplasma iowae]WPL37067.1 tRNA (guanosine(46)-N7)-methyltransferase TrmB [Malacoplasma iowae]WPL38247.1 tRNA (guanosine(46)-N7)-methyltransferase TrmB [Malacoplasma iowae]WPL39737.1 tRNA (guanosine(46)-N7)-methyltransferase TrmB [Malacoplasma iowae]WPL40622.1 tRNA (guanosine(46)-N7)-methyltransferase TrmB [Malacoplasma iowae]
MGRLRRNRKYEEKLFNDTNVFIINHLEYINNWKKQVFKNNNEIHIEIGCGKGDFINYLSKNNENINYVAIDKFPTVLYKALSKVNKEMRNNLKIISTDAKELNSVFGKGEVDKIYLNFSDPWPKKQHEKNRLTNISFLNIFFNILKDGGVIEFKTDNDILFDYTVDVVKSNNMNIHYLSYDLYNDKEEIKFNVPTEYERKWHSAGKTIKKIVFSKI